MSNQRTVTIDVDVREWDLPDDVDLPDNLSVEARIDVESSSESIWEDVPEIATAIEVAVEDATARKLRDLGYVRDENGGDA